MKRYALVGGLAAQQNDETLDCANKLMAKTTFRILVGALCTLVPQMSRAQEVTVVRADNPPVWGYQIALFEELRIGTLMGDPRYTLGSVDDVAVLANGSVWVGDSQLHGVLRYAADGTYLGQVGREGEGPGEFRYVSNLRAAPDGTVWVWDAGLLRVSHFDSSGVFLDSFSPPTFMIGGRMERFEIDQAGALYLIAMSMQNVQSMEPREVSAALAVPRPKFWLELAPDGTVRDSIFLIHSEQEGSVDAIFSQTQLSPLGYRVTARNDEYVVRLEKRDGSVVEIRRDWEPVRYQRAERADAQRMEAVFYGRNGRPIRRIPGEKPPFSLLQIDVEGRLWVQRYVEGMLQPESEGERASREEACAFFGSPPAECEAGVRAWREPKTYDVIDPSGVFLGQVTLPNTRAEIEFAEGDLVWVTEEGEYGEQYIVRYRVMVGR